MSTTATVTEVDVKPELITYGVIKTVDKDGNVTGVKAISREDAIEESEKSGVLLFKQSFSYLKANTVAGITQVIPDEQDALTLFNSGVKVRLNTRINSVLTELDESGNLVFQPQEQAYDIMDAVREASQKRNLSPVEKAKKALLASGLPEAIVEQMISTMYANLSAQASPEAGAEE